MADSQRAINDMYLRSLDCRDTVLTDMPAGSEGAIDAENLRGQYDIIIAETAAQSGFGGTAKMGAGQRKLVRKHIYNYLAALHTSAEILGRKHPGFEQNFPSPSGKDDNELLADARAVVLKAIDNKTLFLGRGIELAFLESGEAFITDFEESLDTSYDALSSRGEAVGSKKSAYDLADEYFDSLNDFVKNFYRDQPAKLAAWKIATRIERPAKKKKDA
jgi:hypothetical protein